MKYKRLTEKNCYALDNRIYNRLRELEDKIDNGTLVELTEPYIEETSYDNNGGALYQVWHSRVETHCSYIDDTFTTKTDAEAGLKELTSKDGE